MRLSRILQLLPIIFANFACRNNARTANPAVAVRIGHFPNLTHAPALLARARGDYEKALAPRPVVWRQFNAGPDAIEALFAGELDLLYVGPGPAINAFVRSGGKELKILAGAAANGAGLVVRNGAHISDARELAGKRLASPQAGNTQDIALRHYLLEHQLNWVERGGTTRILNLPGADQLALFQRGELDGAWAVEPWLSRLQIEGPGSVLVDERSLWPGGSHPTTILAVRPAFLAESPESARAALVVHRHAVAELAAGDPAARRVVEQFLLKLTGQTLSPAVLTAAWNRLVFTDDPQPAALQLSADHAAALGFLTEMPDLSGMVATLSAPAGKP